MEKDATKDWKQFKEAHELEEEVEETIEAEQEDSEDFLIPSYEELEAKLAFAEQDSLKNKERADRALAELENVRRRALKDVENAREYGKKGLVEDLLPVMDSLEQALQLVDPKSDAAMHEGISLTMKLLLAALEKQKIVQVDPLDQPFNPQEHEAMGMQEAENKEPNSVLVVFQKGYKLAERIIRPARVIVAKAKGA